MKYLTDYIEKEQTRLFDKYNVFFAFGTEQFNEQAKDEGLKYVSRGAGMYQGYKDAKELKEFDKKNKKMLENAIKQDLKENGKETGGRWGQEGGGEGPVGKGCTTVAVPEEENARRGETSSGIGEERSRMECMAKAARTT